MQLQVLLKQPTLKQIILIYTTTTLSEEKLY